MGFLDSILGNASEVDLDDIHSELSPILADNEKLISAYKFTRDMFVFTDARLLLIDKQGLTGKKVEYHSIPYRAITQFKVETAGHFDMDSELRIWISGQSDPVLREITGDAGLGVQHTLANRLFG